MMHMDLVEEPVAGMVLELVLALGMVVVLVQVHIVLDQALALVLDMVVVLAQGMVVALVRVRIVLDQEQALALVLDMVVVQVQGMAEEQVQERN